jgi:glycerol-3-phosphate dehydrogenase
MDQDADSMPVEQANRETVLSRLEQERWDLLVIGGGIVGAGVLYAAIREGLRAALVEKHDFAFGTSSRSSRLLHGGLRYLAQGRVRLVFEASQEKLRLARVAPHLVEPLPFLFPAYRGNPWPLWQLWLGVKLYDALCLGRNFGSSEGLSPRQLAELVPGLCQGGLRGAVRYFDALTNDARLVVDTLRAATLRGAVALNYVQFLQAENQGHCWQCLLRDVQSTREFRCAAQWIVNAAGPWAEQFPQSRLRLRLTKGIHLVVPRNRLPIPEALVMAEGQRILFAIPWGERVILGTTDTDYSGSLEDIPVDESDVQYVLSVVNRYFPDARLSPCDIRGSWAGVRPLVGSGRGGPSDISRAHTIRISQPRWVDVAGGKLTTYLLMGEQAVRKVLRALGRKSRCPDPAEPFFSDGQAPASKGILPPPPSEELVRRFCQEEWAMHLDDVMIRRTSWHYYREDTALLSHQVATWMASQLGWDARRQKEELARYRRLCEKYHVPWQETELSNRAPANP